MTPERTVNYFLPRVDVEASVTDELSSEAASEDAAEGPSPVCMYINKLLIW